MDPLVNRMDRALAKFSETKPECFVEIMRAMHESETMSALIYNSTMKPVPGFMTALGYMAHLLGTMIWLGVQIERDRAEVAALEQMVKDA